MATEPQKSKEHPSTYVVQDRSNEEELLRVHLQDQLVTSGMGGALPEQEDPSRFQRVLDVACGTGDWLITLAQQAPDTTLLVGADVSKSIIDYARKQAHEADLAERVEFRVMDALRMLEFPSASFDLVNQRFGGTYLRTWDWPGLLQELRRVARPGATIRITDCDMPTSNTPAFDALQNLFAGAMKQSGHLFSSERDGITSALEPIMRQAGLFNLQTRVHLLEYRAGTKEGQLYAENVQYLFRTTAPFLRKWAKVPGEYDRLYQQALQEMQQPDFVATWRLLTVWGTSPQAERRHLFDPH